LGVGCILTRNGEFEMEYIFSSLKNWLWKNILKHK
jgi:hypothetical protein